MRATTKSISKLQRERNRPSGHFITEIRCAESYTSHVLPPLGHSPDILWGIGVEPNMRTLSCVVVLAGLLLAQLPTIPVNLNFESGELGRAPTGWSFSGSPPASGAS